MKAGSLNQTQTFVVGGWSCTTGIGVRLVKPCACLTGPGLIPATCGGESGSALLCVGVERQLVAQEPRLFALRLTPVCAERRRGDPSHHAAVTVMR